MGNRATDMRHTTVSQPMDGGFFLQSKPMSICGVRIQNILHICQGGNYVHSWNADDLSMTYIETSLAIMTSTTTRFNWTATHLNCPSRSIDIISRFLLGKISSEAIVVWSTMQRYVQFKSLDKLMVVAVWVSWSNVICHSLTCHLDGNERRNQGLVRVSHWENTSLPKSASYTSV